MTDRFWQNWDTGDTAISIDSYWLNSPLEESWRRILADDLSYKFGENVPILEIGSGSGLIYRELLNRHIVTVKSYAGGDISKKMLDIARSRFPEAKFIELDIFSLPFPDKSQTNVISIQVLQHLPHYRDALKELLRITKERLYIASWFNLSSGDMISLTSDPLPGTFYNNRYSLIGLLEFIFNNVGDKIDTLSVRNLNGDNFSIYLKLKNETP
jgi:SAM-dependent methyltransferase